MKKIFALALIGGMLFATACTRKQCPAYGSAHPAKQSAIHRS